MDQRFRASMRVRNVVSREGTLAGELLQIRGGGINVLFRPQKKFGGQIPANTHANAEFRPPKSKIKHES